MAANPYKEARKRQTEETERVVFNAPATLLRDFDEWAASEGFSSRAEALRGVISAIPPPGQPLRPVSRAALEIAEQEDSRG